MTDHTKLSTKIPPDALASGHSGDPKTEFIKSMRYARTRDKRITIKSAWIPDIVKKKLASCIQKDRGVKISMVVLFSFVAIIFSGMGNRDEESFDSAYNSSKENESNAMVLLRELEELQYYKSQVFSFILSQLTICDL
jgi:hypothetical protein